MAEKQDKPPEQQPKPEPKVKEPKAMPKLSRFMVQTRHCPIPKLLKRLEVEAVDESDAWTVYLATVKQRLAGSEIKSDKDALIMLESGMMDGAVKTVSRV